MDIAKKIEIAATAVASIASHSDEDSAVLIAALGVVGKIVSDATLGVHARVANEAHAAITPKPAA